MGRCTLGLIFGSILMCIVTLDQLFRNAFHLYRYNLLLRLLEPVIECRVWNIVVKAERVDGNSFGFALGLVEEPQPFKIFFAKHNLSNFKFSTKVWKRAILVNTPIWGCLRKTLGGSRRQGADSPRETSERISSLFLCGLTAVIVGKHSNFCHNHCC